MASTTRPRWQPRRSVWAMGAAGTDVALETADLVLMGDRLDLIPYAIQHSQLARRVVWQNLAFAIGVIILLVIGAFDEHKADALGPEIARSYGLEELCVFAGWRHDMPEMYALMDVFVLPSHREGFPRAPMEASAMGVPTIVTNIRGCSEAVEHNHNGVLVPLRNSRALACAIIELLTNRAKAHHLGAAGSTLARQQFDEQLVFARVLATYARLLQEKGFAVPQPMHV
ncbi:MAG: glycosyltransferase [Blastochloris sp.]|nr:glycosyltransferase [Blastochloris sp.]